MSVPGRKSRYLGHPGTRYFELCICEIKFIVGLMNLTLCHKHESKNSSPVQNPNVQTETHNLKRIFLNGINDGA